MQCFGQVVLSLGINACICLYIDGGERFEIRYWKSHEKVDGSWWYSLISLHRWRCCFVQVMYEYTQGLSVWTPKTLYGEEKLLGADAHGCDSPQARLNIWYSIHVYMYVYNRLIVFSSVGPFSVIPFCFVRATSDTKRCDGGEWMKLEYIYIHTIYILCVRPPPPPSYSPLAQGPDIISADRGTQDFNYIHELPFHQESCGTTHPKLKPSSCNISGISFFVKKCNIFFPLDGI